VAFGLVPALHASRLELIRTIRGEVTRDGRQGRARNMLVGLQVTASALLLICAVVFLRSALAASSIDPGLRTADTIMIEIVNEESRSRMIEAVRSEPLVLATAATWPDMLGRPRIAVARAAAPDGASAESAGPTSAVAYRFVSPEHFDVLGIEILRGRGFTPAERTAGASAAVVVVSESVARQLWPRDDAVGQVLLIEPEPGSDTRHSGEPLLPSRPFAVVGVSRDVPGFRIAGYNEAGVYVPIDAEQPKTSLTVRVQGDPDQARRSLLQRLTAVDPNMGQVITMRTLARMETYFLQVAFWITVVLGGLALVLTVSGLFSVLSYLVEGNRRPHGARRDHAKRRAAGAVAVARPGRRRAGRGRRAGCRSRDCPVDDAGGCDDHRDRSRAGSGRVRREPARRRVGVRACRARSRAARRTHRSHRHPQAGLMDRGGVRGDDQPRSLAAGPMR
jgi:hypothetical protein